MRTSMAWFLQISLFHWHSEEEEKEVLLAGGFHFQPVTQLNVNEQLWTPKWICWGINVILPLRDYMLYMSLYVMREETKERAAWRTCERQKFTMCRLTLQINTIYLHSISRKYYLLLLVWRFCLVYTSPTYTLKTSACESPDLSSNLNPCSPPQQATEAERKCYSVLSSSDSYPLAPVLLCWPGRWAMLQSNPENSSAPTSTFPWRTTMYRR